MSEVQLLRRGIQTVPVLGDRQTNDSDEGTIDDLQQRRRVIGRVNEFGQRTDDGNRLFGAVMFDQGVEPVLRREYVEHPPIGRQQTRADDAPFARSGLQVQKIVRKARHVRAMETADAEMDDAGCERRRLRTPAAGRVAADRATSRATSESA